VKAIAEAAGWTKQPQKLVDALVEAQYLNQTPHGLYIHDWEEYTVFYIQQRENQKEKVRERVRRYRDSKKTKCNADVTGNVTVTDTQCNAPTVPNLTVPKDTLLPPISPSSTKKSKPKPKKGKPVKEVYGENSNVTLTVDEYSKLCEDYGAGTTQDAVEYLSSYKVERDYKTKSDYLTLRRWVFDAVSKQSVSRPPKAKTTFADIAKELENGY